MEGQGEWAESTLKRPEQRCVVHVTVGLSPLHSGEDDADQHADGGGEGVREEEGGQGESVSLAPLPPHFLRRQEVGTKERAAHDRAVVMTREPS